MADTPNFDHSFEGGIIMAKWKIGGSFGFAGTDWEDVVEADTQEEAEDIARDYTLERVEYWVEGEVK